MDRYFPASSNRGIQSASISLMRWGATPAMPARVVTEKPCRLNIAVKMMLSSTVRGPEELPRPCPSNLTFTPHSSTWDHLEKRSSSKGMELTPIQWRASRGVGKRDSSLNAARHTAVRFLPLCSAGSSAGSGGVPPTGRVALSMFFRSSSIFSLFKLFRRFNRPYEAFPILTLFFAWPSSRCASPSSCSTSAVRLTALLRALVRPAARSAFSMVPAPERLPL
mmetsp:Transcript_40037/g.125305  ORF Transcript_40037/g.125305 Transcript_40037/m.125305 type:complete len:222 (+) Transcript_40037:687-1352(+)